MARKVKHKPLLANDRMSTASASAEVHVPVYVAVTLLGPVLVLEVADVNRIQEILQNRPDFLGKPQSQRRRLIPQRIMYRWEALQVAHSECFAAFLR